MGGRDRPHVAAAADSRLADDARLGPFIHRGFTPEKPARGCCRRLVACSAPRAARLGRLSTAHCGRLGLVRAVPAADFDPPPRRSSRSWPSARRSPRVTSAAAHPSDTPGLPPGTGVRVELPSRATTSGGISAFARARSGVPLAGAPPIGDDAGRRPRLVDANVPTAEDAAAAGRPMREVRTSPSTRRVPPFARVAGLRLAEGDAGSTSTSRPPAPSSSAGPYASSVNPLGLNLCAPSLFAHARRSAAALPAPSWTPPRSVPAFTSPRRLRPGVASPGQRYGETGCHRSEGLDDVGQSRTGACSRRSDPTRRSAASPTSSCTGSAGYGATVASNHRGRSTSTGIPRGVPVPDAPGRAEARVKGRTPRCRRAPVCPARIGGATASWVGSSRRRQPESVVPSHRRARGEELIPR